VEAACAELQEAHARFDREQLRTFDQGGKYAPESAEAHRCGPGSVSSPAAAWAVVHSSAHEAQPARACGTFILCRPVLHCAALCCPVLPCAALWVPQVARLMA
jgi:hypothetical protein